ncbi:chondroitin AC/alginate lyase [Thelephora ganbajun]|uniref:Chondroitin AC/alginate lyase n=1 Tax=Thelephora ganbajun TaxID=370292 RepID=A0ACB6ZFE9_THEGA|nr:chondroitin AC/alginate lyase [Thelephora ganbajun]
MLIPTLSKPNLARGALVLVLGALPTAVHSLTSYANDFVDPDYIVGRKFPANTAIAQKTIVRWANEYATLGPWSVMNKSVVPPTGDKHTYMSWLPYWWPDCSNVGNTTALSREQVYKQCKYVQRDGEFNPDVRLVNDTGSFQTMSDAVLYNTLAWVINGSNIHMNNAVHYIDTWFINPNTFMYPNLDCAQGKRGVGGNNGSHAGVLDLKGMTKISSSIMILRKAAASAWTKDLDGKMNQWLSQYINWLEHNPLALEEKAAANNHGSFYFNQVAALKILAGDNSGALNILGEYFDGIYKDQINADGEQPLEAERTRPYHYRTYNLAAMITNARLAKYAGWDVYQHTSNSGGTIQKALDFAMNTGPGKEVARDLYPNVAAVGAIYGDTNRKYSRFLARGDEAYPAKPYFLWNQPLSDNGWVSRNPNYGVSTVFSNNTATKNGNSGNGSSSGGSTKNNNGSVKVVAGTIALATFSVFAAWFLA